MKVSVTVEDIKHGVQGSCRQCPVARAINRVLPKGQVCRVSILAIDVFEFVTRDYIGSYRTPNSVGVFVADFDRGLGVEPFEFEMSLKWLQPSE